MRAKADGRTVIRMAEPHGLGARGVCEHDANLIAWARVLSPVCKQIEFGHAKLCLHTRIQNATLRAH